MAAKNKAAAIFAAMFFFAADRKGRLQNKIKRLQKIKYEYLERQLGADGVQQQTDVVEIMHQEQQMREAGQPELLFEGDVDADRTSHCSLQSHPRVRHSAIKYFN